MPAKNADIIIALAFNLKVFFPKTLKPTSSSLVASNNFPKGLLTVLCKTKNVIAVITATKIKYNKLELITKPKKEGLSIPGIPNGPLVNPDQFNITDITT